MTHIKLRGNAKVIKLDPKEINGDDGAGLTVEIDGFQHMEYPVEVYLELYEGKLYVRVWDGTTEDPAHTICIGEPKAVQP